MSQKKKKRYAIVGTGSRAVMFRDALVNVYKDKAELAALYDLNPIRMKAWAEDGELNVPLYEPNQFDEMIRKEKIDSVIVTTIDRTHHRFICRAMELGCDIITEKPMTTDENKCREILETATKSNNSLAVSFNYRFAPRNQRVKELLMDKAIGKVLSVHFEWLLDTNHGADYFRRWHRDKRNSGGLLVHKSTHHFDLVNWWLDTVPETVYASGGLKFYGRENAEERGATRFYQRAHGSEVAKSDPFALDLEADEWNRKMYLEAEAADSYHRDQSVFGDGISIEDDLAVMVNYRNGATMTYHLNAYAPWEGYRIAFNGTEGRIQFDVVERPYVSGADEDHNFSRNVKGGATHEVDEPTSLVVQRLWQQPVKIEMAQQNGGGHGGADKILLLHLFDKPESDPLGLSAGVRDGTYSILTGIAGNQSLRTGLPVKVSELIPQSLIDAAP